MTPRPNTAPVGDLDEPAAIRSVLLLAASVGNEFMLDIAESFRDGFLASGIHSELLIDSIPSAPAPGQVQLLVAPHEYVPLFLAKHTRPANLDAALQAVYSINVEQPGSQWFEIAWEYVRRCRGVLDINEEGTREFRRRGIPARTVPLGYVPRLESDQFLVQSDRPIDVLFFGHASRRRDDFFARHGATFASCNARIILGDVSSTRRSGTRGYYAGRDRARLLGSSRIVLNVHAAERTYFETHRAVLALSNRCLFVSETSRHVAPLVEGQHFEMGPLDDLPAICLGHLRRPDRLERIAAAGYEKVTTALRMQDTCASMLGWLQATELRRREGGTIDLTIDDAQRRAVMVGRIATSHAERANGLPSWKTTSNAAYQQSGAPAVSVIVTLYNYAQFIEECLLSVTASQARSPKLEIVVVDDASTDGGPEFVERLMVDFEVPVLLVRKRQNTGLADARNVGVECARAACVFVLDADNWIYPDCLRVLHGELTTTGHAAAYGLIRRFDSESGESAGLISKYEWSVPDLLRRPYIDAMAMFDRSIMRSVGGYSTELIEHGWFGWEDYDLWLKLAQAGYSVGLVPNVLSSYRLHLDSMLHRTNRTSAGIARYFHSKFADLVAAHPSLDGYFGFPAVSPAGAGISIAGTTDSDSQMRCRQLEDSLSAMYQSASWRVTAPLRFLYRLITGRS